MLDTLCVKPLIEKIRYRCTGPDGKVWEVDEFLGENAGLVVAEIELSGEDEPFARPAWVGRRGYRRPPLLQLLPVANPL